MKLFFSYLLVHVKSIIMFAGFTAVFAVVFALSRVPLDAVLYALLICVFLGAVILTVSFCRFRIRYGVLERLKECIADSVDELPQPENLRESQYCDLIRVLYGEKQRVESEKTAAISDMTDYYTLWVHQIKTPIAAMSLLLERDEPDCPRVREQLFRIEEYVEMVLTYIRCDFSGSDYVIRECELDGIIRGVLRKYASSFIGSRLSLKYDGVNMRVLTDEKWLAFVIGQLLSNALKYTSAGSIAICPGDNNSIIIEDTGIGIAAEDLPRIFEKGYTGYNGRADRKSTGIGLYLCRRVLDGLSHRISVESSPGKGTRVTILFPKAKLDFE